MNKEQIISGLKDLIIDRESFINDNDKENIFVKDKKILEEAVKLIENSIPKEVIEEKIEDLKGAGKIINQTFPDVGEYIHHKEIKCLQELLQEKKKII